MMKKPDILLENDALERIEEFSDLFTFCLYCRAEELALEKSKGLIVKEVTVTVNDAHEIISNIINVLGEKFFEREES